MRRKNGASFPPRSSVVKGQKAIDFPKSKRVAGGGVKDVTPALAITQRHFKAATTAEQSRDDDGGPDTHPVKPHTPGGRTPKLTFHKG